MTGGEVVAGAVLSVLFAALHDAIKEAMGGSLTESKPLKDLNATLQTLEPMIIHKIGEHNKELGLPNEVVEDLKRQMQEGVELLRKVSKLKTLELLLRPRYTNQLCELDESLKGLIQELKIQETRDVKEVLLLAREHAKKLEELKASNVELLKILKGEQQHQDSEEDAKDTLALATRKTQQLFRLTGSIARLLSRPEVQEEANKVMAVKDSVKDIKARVELVQPKVDSEEASLLKYAALANAFWDLTKAVSEVNQQTKMYQLIAYETTLKNLKPVIEHVGKRSKKLKAAEVELDNLKVQMEEGVKLVRACHTISYNPFKFFKHCTKLVENSGHLQSMLTPICVALFEIA